MSEPRVNFEITAVIDTKGHLEFRKPCPVFLPDSGFDSITLTGNSRITCAFIGSAECREEADERVVVWLDRLADLIACVYAVPASVVGITSRDCKDSQTHKSEREATVFADVLIVPTPGDKKVSSLAELARKSRSRKCLDLQSLYRQALTDDSLAMRYVLLYRILEFHCGGKQELIDKWIKQKEPGVQKKTDNHGKFRTIYTITRNEIHFHQSDGLFPYSSIKKQTGKLRRLVRELIDDQCK